MLLGVLLAGLGGLANLLADNLPLAVLVFLDGVKKGLALILGELGVVHILVPMLLHTTFRTRGESLTHKLAAGPWLYIPGTVLEITYLGDLSPALARVTHLLEPKLFRGGPRGIGTALLHRGWGRRRGDVIYYRLRGSARGCGLGRSRN